MVLQCFQIRGKDLSQLIPSHATLLTSSKIASFSALPAFSDWLYGALIAAGFVGLIAIAEVWHQTKQPPVEWSRKLVHFGGGLVCLTLPFLIHSHWVILCLAASMGAIFVVSKKNNWLQSIHGIDRPSAGSEFYPVVIYLCFVLCNGLVWKYVICVLVLAVSDSVAALIGKKFGRWRFRVEEEYKSVIGCITFFVITFVSVLVPLLIWDPLFESSAPIWHYILTASLIGLLVTCIELVSLKGTDNFWIPLGTLLVLTKTMQTDVYDLGIQNFSFVTLLVMVIIVAFISKAFNASSSILFCLSVYGCWAMGSFDWALPIFTGYVLYLIMSYIAEVPWSLRVRSVLYNVLVPFLILAAANLFLNIERLDLYQFMFVPFLGAVCVSLTQACANLIGWKYRKELSKRLAITTGLALLVSMSICLPAVLRNVMEVAPNLIWVVAITLVISLTSCRVAKPLPPGDAPLRWLYMRSGLVFLAGLGLIVAEALSLIEVAGVL